MGRVGRLFCVTAIWAALGTAQSSDSQAAGPGEVATTFELSAGGVFVDVDGNGGKFRTDRNVRPGFNTNKLYLDLRPANEAEAFFDFLTVSAFGMGDSSPYQRGEFRAGKRKDYDLKAGYRKYSYFFGLPEFALGWHPEDSVGRTANVSLAVFPDRKATVVGGYRRHQLFGTRFTSQDLGLDAFPASYPRRLSSDEVFGGVRLKGRTASLHFDQSYLRFKDDQQLFPNGEVSVGPRGNRLAEGQRDAPTRITTPISRVLGRFQPSRRYDVTGRYIYSGADLDISRLDNLLFRIGQGQFPTRQVVSSSGVSEKPSHSLGMSQSVDITDRLSFHHRFVYETYTLTGLLETTGVLSLIGAGGASLELPFTASGGTVTEYVLGRNEAELEFAVAPSVSVVGGHIYSDRHLAFGDGDSKPRPVVTITNAGYGGLIWRPGLKGGLRAELEKGVASAAFNRTDPLSYQRWKIRGEVRPMSRLTVSANSVIEDNANDTAGVNFDLDNRQAGVQAVYVPSERVTVSGGYNYSRLRTSTGIVFYMLSELNQGLSVYETDLHVVHALVEAPIGERLDLRAGYEYIKDGGATFPLKMQTPRAGLSLMLHRHVHFEADWRHYSYNEAAYSIRDYRANVLAVGLRFTN